MRQALFQIAVAIVINDDERRSDLSIDVRDLPLEKILAFIHGGGDRIKRGLFDRLTRLISRVCLKRFDALKQQFFAFFGRGVRCLLYCGDARKLRLHQRPAAAERHDKHRESGDQRRRCDALAAFPSHRLPAPLASQRIHYTTRGAGLGWAAARFRSSGVGRPESVLRNQIEGAHDRED